MDEVEELDEEAELGTQLKMEQDSSFSSVT